MSSQIFGRATTSLKSANLPSSQFGTAGTGTLLHQRSDTSRVADATPLAFETLVVSRDVTVDADRFYVPESGYYLVSVYNVRCLLANGATTAKYSLIDDLGEVIATSSNVPLANTSEVDNFTVFFYAPPDVLFFQLALQSNNNAATINRAVMLLRRVA